MERFLARARQRLSREEGVETLTRWFETGLRDAFLLDARRIAEDFFNDRRLVPDDTPPLPGETVHKDRPVKVRTIFGAITLRRDYFHHANSRSGRAPLDLALDLADHHTPALAELICQASANAGGSYEEAAGILNLFTGLRLEPRSFHRLVNRLAPELADAQATLPPSGDNKPIPILYIQNDGTGLPCRPEELAGRPGKQPDGTARTREAKLGCVFTQTTTDEHGEPMRDPASTSYAGTMGDCRDSGAQLRAEALRRGLALARIVIFLGDGAAWIWENARLFFPGAIQILDFYHAVEHLGALARALYGEGAFATARQRAWASELKRSDMHGILDQAARLLAANPDLPAQRLEDAQREMTYFTTHWERTRYGLFRQQGYFIGSGVVEAGCKTVIGRRLKQSGMFWGHAGAENILQLRCLLKGPHFHAAWQARRPILAARQAKARRWSKAS
ncbi:MAG: ISKra4 family transposase [Akkermansiaceae bacterium]|jgi:hypothetical protein|nr:ISKra4 family transposase [Akkermansiaceae bacterium]